MNNEKQNHIINYLKKDLRFDGRKREDYRKIEVETGIFKTAEGSARVKIGDTEVLAGVKFEVGKPYPDTPEEGTLMVNSELIPMSSPKFESGPPSPESIELSRVVDRGIRESKAIDYKKMCIRPGELVYSLVVDIVPVNAAGNLFDAAALAVWLAIKDAKFPKLEGDKLKYKEPTKQKLPILTEPVSITVYKIANYYLVDPTPDEEEVMDARLTVALTEDGTICALQKGGEEPLSKAEIESMIGLASKKAKELRKYLR
ncbi:MAG: exosome complex protein Rrp42 [Candidatus Woesearchaeota archaeon]|nr:exosome complex protein Rrp42 [Candidatus Woesearchaeota archaeon]